jgi:uncharacterized protein (TIGR02145 family)
MKRLIFLPVALCTILSDCKEEKEKPIYFETTASTSYTFSKAADSASFTVSSNAAWALNMVEDQDWCSVTPASGKGDATVTVRVAANSVYNWGWGRTVEFVVTTGDYSKLVTITQAAPPCPDFSAGAIATTGQTMTIGGTPATIGSVQDATGVGIVSYQWYRDGDEIGWATDATYTPSSSSYYNTDEINTAGVYTYTRRAKDEICNTIFTPSTGNWVLTVTCSFDPGAIATTGQNILTGGVPVTITSTVDASDNNDYYYNSTISYQWYKNGVAIEGATTASYTPPKADAATAGVYTYTRGAKDGYSCDIFTPSTGSWVLTVTAGCHSAGSTTTFSNFVPCASSSYGDTWQLTDERDEKTYKVRYLPDERYWMVQDLRYGGSRDACVNKTSFSGGSSEPTHRFGTNTYGDCTNIKNDDTPADRGYLYDWVAAMQNYWACSGITESANACQGLCPSGFHIPTREEYTHADAMFKGYYGCDGANCWLPSNQWSGVLGGYYYYYYYNDYYNNNGLRSQGSSASYWSSSYYDSPSAYFSSLPGLNSSNGGNGMSVRCVRNY